MRKSHTTITRHQEDKTKQSKQLSLPHQDDCKNFNSYIYFLWQISSSANEDSCSIKVHLGEFEWHVFGMQSSRLYFEYHLFGMQAQDYTSNITFLVCKAQDYSLNIDFLVFKVQDSSLNMAFLVCKAQDYTKNITWYAKLKIII